MRCPDCNKFVAFDTETEPEVQRLDVDEEGTVSGIVRIVNTCAECGTEMKEFLFDVETRITPPGVDAHIAAIHTKGGVPDGTVDFSIEENDVERTQRTTGHGRGTKTFYGISLSYTISCKCGWTVDDEGHVVNGDFTVSGDVSDDVQASAMDEL